jgi:BirA family transcriptional regulator, biotin operon repressor / biotin---[acetyl-CoA-carboxylase] ligase
MAGETAHPAGLRWIHHASVASTNDLVLDAARAGEAAGLWVTADRQTSGRGRGGRTWASEPGNFYGSLLYRTEKPLAELSLLPLAAALGVKNALEEVAPEAARARTFALKWPNDVLLAGAKVAGILLESERAGDGTLAVAIGCGINVAHHPPGTAFPATHLAAHGAPALAIEAVLERLARTMAAALGLFEEVPEEVRARGRGGRPPRARGPPPGGAGGRPRRPRGGGGGGGGGAPAACGAAGPLTVRLASQTLHGTFAGLDEGGRLLLQEGGALRTIATGDLFFGAPSLSEEAPA